MGYTRISGTPIITALFAILIPTMLYAFLGSSRHLVVGADSATAALGDVDFSTAAALRGTHELLKQKSIRLVLAEIQNSVRAELERSKITDLIGRPNVFSTIQELENAYKQSAGTVRETRGNYQPENNRQEGRF